METPQQDNQERNYFPSLTINISITENLDWQDNGENNQHQHTESGIQRTKELCKTIKLIKCATLLTFASII